jgi:hypothetical protein
MFWMIGCSSTTTTSNGGQSQQGPQTYFAPYVAGATYADGNYSLSLSVPQTYSIDDTGGAFSQTAYGLHGNTGAQILDAGVLAVGQRGLRSLGIDVNYICCNSSNGNSGFYPSTYPTPEPGSFALELAGQASGLVQMVGQPVAPLVAAPQTYQFVTIPSPLRSPGSAGGGTSWDPTAETAYGSVDIASTGTAVTLQNIHQLTLPSVGGTGIPATSGPSSAAGACAPTYFGNITNMPSPAIITDPGANQVVSPQAKIGIGANGGLLVEDDQAIGILAESGGVPPPPPYNNTLGAGTGAVGLPKPLSALDTGAVVAAQYLGFIYAAGTSRGTPPIAWSSHLASFGGYSNLPSGCDFTAGAGISTLIGGDFPQSNGQDDPSASPDGFGNNDFAIDLGTQSTAGLYTGATVCMGANYAGNITGATYTFSAVAIAGQLDGKYAIFVLGADSTQPWAIYLLQSN